MSTTAKNPVPTKNDVLVVAQRLMLAAGQTTTLEVKIELRKAGFHALQDDISKTMGDLAAEENWQIGDTGTHRLYAGVAIQQVLHSSIAMIAAVNNGAKIQVKPTQPANVKTTPATVKGDGTIAKSAAKKGDWETNSVISTVNTVLYFPAAIGKDKARSLFAKLTGTPRNDARVRLVK